jgi:hypothetical protein
MVGAGGPQPSDAQRGPEHLAERADRDDVSVWVVCREERPFFVGEEAQGLVVHERGTALGGELGEPLPGRAAELTAGGVVDGGGDVDRVNAALPS